MAGSPQPTPLPSAQPLLSDTFDLLDGMFTLGNTSASSDGAALSEGPVAVSRACDPGHVPTPLVQSGDARQEPVDRLRPDLSGSKGPASVPNAIGKGVCPWPNPHHTHHQHKTGGSLVGAPKAVLLVVGGGGGFF